MIKYGWIGEIVNIETAFLYGDLDKEIYLKIPTGLYLITGENYDPSDCLILLKTMYGLVQAARQFYKKLTHMTVTKTGFVKCEADECLLIRVNHVITVILCIYVENMLVVGDKEAVEIFKQEIKQLFNTKEDRSMEEYIGCKVVRKGNNKLQITSMRRIFIEVCEICKYQTPATPTFSVQRPGSNDVLILS